MILDVGCGSGLSGEILSSIDPSEGGPHIWVGMDISASMLDIALREFEEGWKGGVSVLSEERSAEDDDQWCCYQSWIWSWYLGRRSGNQKCEVVFGVDSRWVCGGGQWWGYHWGSERYGRGGCVGCEEKT